MLSLFAAIDDELGHATVVTDPTIMNSFNEMGCCSRTNTVLQQSGAILCQIRSCMPSSAATDTMHENEVAVKVYVDFHLLIESFRGVDTGNGAR